MPRAKPQPVQSTVFEHKECCATCKFCLEDSEGAYCFVEPPFDTGDGSYGRGKNTRAEAPACRFFILKRELMS